MSEEGYKKILEEINYLESVERPKASAAIAEAREKGDLSENAEYDAAKEAQGKLESKIAILKDQVANARIIDASKLNADKVQIMTTVRLLNKKMKKEMTYTIVAESEANFREGKISVGTPIAKALLDIETIEEGDNMDIQAMKTLLKYKIQRIEELERQIEHLEAEKAKDKLKNHEKIDNIRTEYEKKIDFLKGQIILKDKRIDLLLDVLLRKE